MATDKKSFLLYCDLIHTVNKLDNEKAGELFKHILSYVNDENPTPTDFILELVFEPIKQSLKRDLQRYEAIKERNRVNGARGGRPLKQENPNNPVGFLETQENPKNPVEPKKADSDSDSDSDIDIDIDSNNKVKKVKFNFRSSFLMLGVDEGPLDDWLNVRRVKKASNTQTAYNGIVKQIELSGLTANDCIKIAAENSWQGFKAEWVKNTTYMQPSQEAKKHFPKVLNFSSKEPIFNPETQQWENLPEIYK